MANESFGVYSLDFLKISIFTMLSFSSDKLSKMRIKSMLEHFSGNKILKSFKKLIMSIGGLPIVKL